MPSKKEGVNGGTEVEVDFDYTAEQPDELSIKKGDIVTNVLMVEGGWWEGDLNGKKGMFPDNFVKVIRDPAKEVKREVPKKEDLKVQASKRQSVKDLANKIKAQVPDGPIATRKKDLSVKKKRAKVIYSYTPENDDEIKLEVGDSVELLAQEEEGWWEGIVNGKTGMFPSNFVEISEEDDTAIIETAESKETESKLIQGKKITGVGFGNIFGSGPIKLRSADGPTSAGKPTSATEKSHEKVQEKKAPERPAQRRSKDKVTVKVTDINLGRNIDRENAGDFVNFEDLPVDFIQNYDIGFDYIEKVSSTSDVLERNLGITLDTPHSDGYMDAEIRQKLESLTDIDNMNIQNVTETVNEEELIEYADIDISPDKNFNCQHISREPLTSGYVDLKIPLDYGAIYQVCTPKRNTYTGSQSNDPISQGHLSSPGIPQGIQSVLDDLDSCLDMSFNYVDISELNIIDPPDDSNVDTGGSDCSNGNEAHVENLCNKTDGEQFKKPTRSVASGLVPTLGWEDVEQRTPPSKTVHPPVDSVLLAKKRFQHAAENQDNQTPLKGKSDADGHQASFEELRDSVSGDTCTLETGEQHRSRRSVAFLPDGTMDSETTRRRCFDSLYTSSSPKNYFASLNESGNLSPFIRSIANKYKLFDNTLQEQEQASFAGINNLHKFTSDMETSESYTSFLLGHSFDVKMNETGNDSLKIAPTATCDSQMIDKGHEIEDNSIPISTDANKMLSNYVYEVVTGEHKSGNVSADTVPSFMTGETASDMESSGNMIRSEDLYMESAYAVQSCDESLAVCVDDASSRFCDTSCKDLSGEAEADSFDSDPELSGILLCMTREVDDSPPLSNCSPSLYPVVAQSTPCKVTNVAGSGVCNVNKSIAEDVQTRKPAKQGSHRMINGSNVYFKGPKLPDGGELRQTSSYCRIPFGATDAPPFWFRKDFTESPKQKDSTANPESVNLRKLIFLKVPPLFSLAEKVYMNNFRKRLDNIIGKHKSSFTEPSFDSVDGDKPILDRSPAKKRRRRNVPEMDIGDSYDSVTVGTSLFSPISDDWGSVESYFASLIADVPDLDIDPIASPGSINLKYEDFDDNDALPKIDWSTKLFGRNATCIQPLIEINSQTTADQQFVSPVPLKGCYNKSQRLLYSVDRTSSSSINCSAKRKKMPFWHKAFSKPRSSSELRNSVQLTAYRKFTRDNFEYDSANKDSPSKIPHHENDHALNLYLDDSPRFIYRAKGEHRETEGDYNCPSEMSLISETLIRPIPVRLESPQSNHSDGCPHTTLHEDKRESDTSTMKNIFAIDEGQSLFKHFFMNEESTEPDETKGLTSCEELPLSIKFNLDQIDTATESHTRDNNGHHVYNMNSVIGETEQVEHINSVQTDVEPPSPVAESRGKVQFRCSTSHASSLSEDAEKVSVSPVGDDDVFDITPDPDTLLYDLKELDLSGTPQYASDSVSDREIRQFLSATFEPFDDILVESFSSVIESPTKSGVIITEIESQEKAASSISPAKGEIVKCNVDDCIISSNTDGEVHEHWSLYPKCDVQDSETQTDFDVGQASAEVSKDDDLLESVSSHLPCEDEAPIHDSLETKLNSLRKWYDPEVYPTLHGRIPCYQTEETLLKEALTEHDGVEYDAPEDEELHATGESPKHDFNEAGEGYYDSSPEIIHYINSRMRNLGVYDHTIDNSCGNSDLTYDNKSENEYLASGVEEHVTSINSLESSGLCHRPSPTKDGSSSHHLAFAQCHGEPSPLSKPTTMYSVVSKESSFEIDM